MTEVLIADDSLLLREGLSAVLAEEGIGVAGKVDSAAALHVALARAAPDVVLVGIPLPPVGRDEGLSAIECMKRSHPDLGVLVLSSYFDPALAVQLIARRPASTGYLLKGPLPDPATLVRALRVVEGGGTFVDRVVSERLHRERGQTRSLDCLSEREQEILALMARGRTNNAISAALYLSPKTVESHVRAIFNKLDLRAAASDHRRVLAVLRYLREAGWDQEAQPAVRGTRHVLRRYSGGAVG